MAMSSEWNNAIESTINEEYPDNLYSVGEQPNANLFPGGVPITRNIESPSGIRPAYPGRGTNTPLVSTSTKPIDATGIKFGPPITPDETITKPTFMESMKKGMKDIDWPTLLATLAQAVGPDTAGGRFGAGLIRMRQAQDAAALAKEQILLSKEDVGIRRIESEDRINSRRIAQEAANKKADAEKEKAANEAKASQLYSDLQDPTLVKGSPQYNATLSELLDIVPSDVAAKYGLVTKEAPYELVQTSPGVWGYAQVDTPGIGRAPTPATEQGRKIPIKVRGASGLEWYALDTLTGETTPTNDPATYSNIEEWKADVGRKILEEERDTEVKKFLAEQARLQDLDEAALFDSETRAGMGLPPRPTSGIRIPPTPERKTISTKEAIKKGQEIFPKKEMTALEKLIAEGGEKPKKTILKTGIVTSGPNIGKRKILYSDGSKSYE